MKINLFQCAVLFAFLFFACEKWDYNQRSFDVPEVRTISIDKGNFNRTVAYGQITGLELGDVIQAGHCWLNYNINTDTFFGPTLAHAHTELTGDSVRQDGSFESEIIGLSSDSLYYILGYAIYILNGKKDTIYEEPKPTANNFLYLFIPAPLNLSALSVRLEGENARVVSAVTGLTYATADTFGHCWSNQPGDPRWDDGASQYTSHKFLNRDSVFEDVLSNLGVAQTYYVRSYVMIKGKTFYSNTLSIFVGDLWVRHAQLNDGWSESVGFCLNEKIYIGTGNRFSHVYDVHASFMQYNPVTKSWTPAASLPFSTPSSSGRGMAVSFVVAGKAYVGLGCCNISFCPSNFYAYDPGQDEWVEKAPFPGNLRAEASAFSIDDKGYVTCGMEGCAYATDINDTWCYYPLDTSNGLDVNGEPMGRWIKKTDFTGLPRHSSVAFAIGDKGYLATGYSNELWEYDPLDTTNGLDEINQPKGAWKRRADVGFFNRNNALGFSIGGFGYIGGGYDSNGNALTDWWRYDPLQNEWTPINFIPDGQFVEGVGVSNAGRGFVYRLQKKDNANSWESHIWEYIPVQ